MPRRHDAAFRAPARPGARTVARAAAVMAAVLISGCSASSAPSVASPSHTGSAEANSSMEVVASTSAWGDIAQQLGGQRVHVQSFVNDLSQDPHEYQPTGRDELALSRASVVIVNGGGYDDVLSQMLDSVPSKPIVVTAVEAAASVDSFDPDNEHVWFNLDAVNAVAAQLTDAFTRADPGSSSEFRANRDEFEASIAPLSASVQEIRAQHQGAPVAVTEPLPMYLIRDAGLHNIIGDAVTEAIEEGIDVSALDLAHVLSLLSDHAATLLVYNEQSTTTQTEEIRDSARENDIPVVTVTEIPPPGEHYQQWIGGVIDALSSQLDAAA